MGLFDKLKKSFERPATANIATIATNEGGSVAIVAKVAVATSKNETNGDSQKSEIFHSATANIANDPIHSLDPERGVMDDEVSRHPDSCPDCATQPNCPARRDCLELVKAGYRADPHDVMTCSCLRCLGIRGERPGTDPSSSPDPNSEGLASIRSQIERLLADGPKPYELILEAVGGEEAAIRKAIRGWDELIGYVGEGGVFMWEVRSGTAKEANDPLTLAERIGMRFEAEIPDEKGLGSPVFTYRGHILAWEADPPHIRLYAWCLANLFPGRPLTVDVEPVAPLLGLSPREVREALARLVKDGDLIRSWEGRREWYRLSVRYPVNGGKDETGD